MVLKDGTVLLSTSVAGAGNGVWECVNGKYTQRYTAGKNWQNFQEVNNGCLISSNDTSGNLGILFYSTVSRTITRIQTTGDYWKFRYTDNDGCFLTCNTTSLNGSWYFDSNTKQLTQLWNKGYDWSTIVPAKDGYIISGSMTYTDSQSFGVLYFDKKLGTTRQIYVPPANNYFDIIVKSKISGWFISKSYYGSPAGCWFIDEDLNVTQIATVGSTWNRFLEIDEGWLLSTGDPSYGGGIIYQSKTTGQASLVYSAGNTFDTVYKTGVGYLISSSAKGQVADLRLSPLSCTQVTYAGQYSVELDNGYFFSGGDYKYVAKSTGIVTNISNPVGASLTNVMRIPGGCICAISTAYGSIQGVVIFNESSKTLTHYPGVSGNVLNGNNFVVINDGVLMGGDYGDGNGLYLLTLSSKSYATLNTGSGKYKAFYETADVVLFCAETNKSVLVFNKASRTISSTIYVNTGATYIGWRPISLLDVENYAVFGGIDRLHYGVLIYDKKAKTLSQYYPGEMGGYDKCLMFNKNYAIIMAGSPSSPYAPNMLFNMKTGAFSIFDFTIMSSATKKTLPGNNNAYYYPIGTGAAI